MYEIVTVLAAFLIFVVAPVLLGVAIAVWRGWTKDPLPYSESPGAKNDRAVLLGEGRFR